MGLTSRLLAADPGGDAIHDVSSGEVVRYAELAARVERVVDGLRGAGVVEGTRVAARLRRGPMRVLAPLACWSLGATYVPTEPDWSDALHERILGLAAATVFLDPQGVPGRIGGAHRETGGEDLRVILRTSGTTGSPRLVGMTQENLRWFIDSHPHALELRPGQRVAQFAPHTFDLFLCELIAALSAGACLVLLPPEACGGFGLASISDTLERARIEFMVSTPSVLELVEPGPSLRCVCSGGERLTAASVRRLSRGGCEVINIYGPSETTIFTHFHRCDPTAHEDPPFGVPLPGVELTVRAIDDGSPGGELVVDGPCVTPGYVARDDPGGFLDDGRYATGDRVVCNDRGEWEFLGRIDWQCKVGGVRVDPDEVARALERHEGVDAAVVFVEDRETAPWLRAVYIGEVAIEDDALRASLRGYLPRVATPSQFVHATRWPTNARGKLDRAALRAEAGLE